MFQSSYLISYPVICLIDVIYLNAEGENAAPLDIYARQCFCKKKKKRSLPLSRATPSVLNSHLWHFFNTVSRFLELGGDNSRSPFLPPSQRGHCEVTASITPPQPSHIICWLVSQDRDFSLKVPFNTSKCGLWPLANVLFALNTCRIVQLPFWGF